MRLTKHHGLGNDFLVVDTSQRLPPRIAWPITARRLCDRRLGVGADGLLLLTPKPPADGGADVAMAIYNADGNRAEMSGNGIRCLAQAELLRRREPASDDPAHPTILRIATDTGVRTVCVAPGPDRHTVDVTVAMGPVADTAPPSGWSAIGCDPLRPVVHLSLGNPHSVVGVEDLAVVDLETIGRQVPDVNLEIITAGNQHHEIVMRVHERGVGITPACGTGAVAGAHAAVRWGLAAPKDGEIVVRMDGGEARVRLADEPGGSATLIGPATFVASLEVPG